MQVKPFLWFTFLEKEYIFYPFNRHSRNKQKIKPSFEEFFRKGEHILR